MKITQKGTRVEAESTTAEEFLQSEHESVAKGEEVEEYDASLDSEKRERDISDWIVQPNKTPSRN